MRKDSKNLLNQTLSEKPRLILVIGDSGSGKSSFCNCIAGELGLV